MPELWSSVSVDLVHVHALVGFDPQPYIEYWEYSVVLMIPRSHL